MDVRTEMLVFSRILTALTEVLGRDIRADRPRTSAGYPSQNLPLWDDFSFLTSCLVALNHRLPVVLHVGHAYLLGLLTEGRMGLGKLTDNVGVGLDLRSAAVADTPDLQPRHPCRKPFLGNEN